MKLYRVLAVSRRVFRDVVNDKRTLAMLFLAPIFAMTVFGLAFSGDVEDVNTIVVNQDQGFTPQWVTPPIYQKQLFQISIIRF